MSLEKEMATHSSILAWKIPWTEEPGRLQSMGPSQQLFEPSRVCKSCYSSLHPTSSSIDLELDKPIAATSN